MFLKHNESQIFFKLFSNWNVKKSHCLAILTTRANVEITFHSSDCQHFGCSLYSTISLFSGPLSQSLKPFRLGGMRKEMIAMLTMARLNQSYMFLLRNWIESTLLQKRCQRMGYLLGVSHMKPRQTGLMNARFRQHLVNMWGPSLKFQRLLNRRKF